MPAQWIQYDAPEMDEHEAWRRQRVDPICTTCRSGGLVCPACNGMRWVRNEEIAPGLERRVVPCAGCMAMIAGQPHFDVDLEQKTIALWLYRPAQRITHPIVANPTRNLAGDPALRAQQQERARQQREAQHEQAKTAYAEYVRLHGDPRAHLRQRTGGHMPADVPADEVARMTESLARAAKKRSHLTD